MVIEIDIHDRPVAEWGETVSVHPGTVVRVRIICVHPFGVGVELIDHECYGHVNAPRVTDGRFTVEEFTKSIGKVRRAVVLSTTPGRQPTLTLRVSDIS